MTLLPCPFCGGKSPKLSHQEGRWFVHCVRNACRASGPSFSAAEPRHMDQAKEAWNRRKLYEPK